jgi:hypothetical protein
MYADQPGWHSEQLWLSAVQRWANSRVGRRACQNKITSDTLLRIASALARYADYDTGRRCAPSQNTIADELGCVRKTVQRAEHILAAAGLLTVIHGGGNYTHAMHRQYARLRRAGHQLIKPDHCTRIRALTLPRKHRPVHNVSLPTVGRSPCPSYSPTTPSNARIRAREAAARPKTQQRQTEWRRQQPVPIALQLLAAALVALLPWLARGRHIGAVCDALSWNGIQSHRWGNTPAAAADTLLAELAKPGPIPTGDTCRSPIGWLHHALQRVDTSTPTPAEQHQANRAALQDDQNRWRAQNAADREAAITLDESSASDKIRKTLRNLKQTPARDLPSTGLGALAWRRYT